MPFIGLGLHILVALYFAIHAIRHGHDIYWVPVLFFFPVLGTVVYVRVVFLPTTRRPSRRAAARTVDPFDPRRVLREAQAAFTHAPTAEAERRLAMALFDAGAFAEAAKHYESCLQGAFAGDPATRIGAARAAFAGEHWGTALHHLEFLRRADPAYLPEAVSLLLARTLAGAGRRAEARVEFEDALVRFHSFEVRVEFAIWAVISGELEVAAQMQSEIQAAMQRWDRDDRDANRPLLRRLHAAYDVVSTGR